MQRAVGVQDGERPLLLGGPGELAWRRWAVKPDYEGSFYNKAGQGAGRE